MKCEDCGNDIECYTLLSHGGNTIDVEECPECCIEGTFQMKI